MQSLLSSFQQLLSSLAHPIKRYCIAFSGGRDSHILLDLAARTVPASQLFAIHIHHGWHPAAQQWIHHCHTICQTLNIPLMVQSVEKTLQSSQYIQQHGGPEAAARHARYAALTAALQPEDCLLTAHHQQDQAETVLLQLIRGAGPAGLAGMPTLSDCTTVYHLRPLLNWTSADLSHYATQYGLQWIEDSSNRDTRFARNFIRHEILTALQARWPSVTKTLSRAAHHCAETQDLLTEIATQDLAQCLSTQSHILSIQALKALSYPRRCNTLRYWFKQLGLMAPSTAQFQQIEQLLQANPAKTNPQFCWKNKASTKPYQLRCYRENLYALLDSSPIQLVDCSWDWHQPLTLADQRTLHAHPCVGQGIRASALIQAPLQVRFRSGGERFRPQGRSGSHPLKKLFQEWGIPSWERSALPLLYHHGQCIAIVGYAVDHATAANPTEPGIMIEISNRPLA